MIDASSARPAPRIAFIPVSGRFGMGEYVRSLAIAHEVRARWPAADIHFLVSREAPYAAGVPFPATLLPSSATFNTPAVIAWMQRWRPTVVVFDNAGRSAQLGAARRLGAKIVYISARRRQRRKAFRLRWMRLLDEHWIAYPLFIAGGFTWLERLKLRAMGRPRVRYLDVILSRGETRRGAEWSTAWGLDTDGFVLVVPGGGTGHPGAMQVTGQFLDAARALAAHGVPVAYVGPVAPAPREELGRLHLLGPLPQPDLAQLLQRARVVIANGGSTLLQAVACLRPNVAIGIADDQAARIERCAAAGVTLAAPAESAHIVTATLQLWNDPERRAVMTQRARALGLADGVAVAADALCRLIDGGE